MHRLEKQLFAVQRDRFLEGTDFRQYLSRSVDVVESRVGPTEEQVNLGLACVALSVQKVMRI